ncbi:MAG: class I SAM-dependent methyltransferase [Candidatus Chloroheliales bacterium]|nr:MAG: class I SAM-dependent methyltransferase [Chloroflexota bacterium]
MSTQAFSATQYKQGQRREWNDAADGWQKWWPIMERGHQPISEQMMEWAEIRPGQRVLDVATGIGEPALTAARQVGPGGKVVATDLAPEMLRIAAERAAGGLHNIEFRAMDAETLDFPEASFDAVLCRFGLMFLPDLEATLQRMLRLLTPGGHICAAVWGAAPRVPFMSVPLGVLMRGLRLPPPLDVPTAFKLADTARLTHAFTQTGFSTVRTGLTIVAQEWKSGNELVSFLQDVSAPMKAMLASQTPERQAELWQMVAAAMQPFTQPDGRIITHNEVILVGGRR